jgi:NAD(P)-dependent dehydrogenase (short-subunit alcohol dehydrogenase family)
VAAKGELGGSSGIGLATAQAALREGASVNTLPNAEGYAVDLTDAAAVQAFFARIGAFDYLVFTAGESLQLGPLASTDLENARQFFNLRYWGAYLAAKYASGSIPRGRLDCLHLRNRRPEAPHRLGLGCKRH